MHGLTRGPACLILCLVALILPVHGQDSERVFVEHVLAGKRAYDEGRWEAVVKHYGWVRDNPGGNDVKHARTFANVLTQLAYAELSLGLYDNARSTLDLSESKGAARALCEYYRGMICRRSGQFSLAEKHFDAAMDQWEAQFLRAESADRVRVQRELANVRSERALLRQAQGRYGEARVELEEAQRLWDQVNPQDNDKDKARCLSHLGNLCRDLGDLAAAETWFVKSRTIWKNFPDHPGHAECLLNQALLHATLAADGRTAPAERQRHQRFANQCCSACLRICGKQPPSIDQALALSNYGWILHGMNWLDEADQAYSRSCQLWADLQPDHQEHARTLCNYGWLQHCRNNRDRALDLYQAGLKKREQILGKDHHAVALSQVNVAALHASNGDWAKARGIMHEALQGLRRYEVGELAMLPDTEQLNFLLHQADAQSHVSIYHLALSMARAGKADPEIARVTAEWLINGKAVSQEAVARKTLLSRDLANPALLHELARVRSDLARLSADPAAQKQGPQQAALRQLVESRRRLEAQLAEQLKAAGFQDDSSPWVPLTDVRANLPDQAVLIELARYRDWNFASSKRDPWEGNRYGAWVIPKHGEVRFVDLGEAQPIDAAAQAVQKAMDEFPEAIKGKPIRIVKELEQSLRAGPLAQLKDRVLAPLSAAIDAKTCRWIVSPDGDLWLVPFAALPGQDGKYLISTHTISYAVTGRDLAAPRIAREPRPSIVIADPEYGRGTRNLGTLRDISFGRLPFALAEADAVAKQLPDAKPVIKGQAASKPAFLGLRGPRVLHLVTHGFALGDDAAPGGHPHDPLGLCGLALAGANETGPNDGLLLGREVLAADLRGTELVALSACQTGLGKVSDGEAVASLRQAFHLAGAQNVLATLWNVSDKHSAVLCVDFYQNCRQPLRPSHAEALRSSQCDVLDSLQKDQGISHPFFWAAFTLTCKGPGR